ncbi:MAG: hypothetical protein LBI15_10070 [Dysgonamonadaceae bacterium]|jgi:hypothetical protein|nr:hypothetical protein [Dysgonamonadaceae bacterium]
MKKSIHIFLCVFLSALIFYGGSGVNAYFFCCDSCRVDKNIIAGSSCCDTSEHIVLHTNNNACLSHHLAEGKCCGVNRIEFDLQSVSDSKIDLQPLCIDLNHSMFLLAHEVKPTTEHLPLYRLLNRQSQNPPDLSKDDYFDLLCTLII